MKKYKALFIDWDDTIGDFSTSAIKAQRDLYDKHHLSEFFPSFEAYYEAYHEHNAELWERYGRGEITKEFLKRDRTLYILVQALGGIASLMQSPRLIALADEMCEEFLALTNHYACLMEDASDVVRELAECYPLVVVSNGFIEVQHYKIGQSGLGELFEDIVLSEDVGITKPNAEIFDIALSRVNERRARRGEEVLQKADILMIGDGYGSDIQGAKNAGIDQLFVCHTGEQMADESLTATYKVRHLRDILSIL